MKKKIIISAIASVIVLAAVITAVVFISNAAVKGSAEERLTAANALQEDGKLTKAENTYKSILEEDSGNKDAAIGLADVYVKKGK